MKKRHIDLIEKCKENLRRPNCSGQEYKTDVRKLITALGREASVAQELFGVAKSIVNGILAEDQIKEKAEQAIKNAIE